MCASGLARLVMIGGDFPLFLCVFLHIVGVSHNPSSSSPCPETLMRMLTKVLSFAPQAAQHQSSSHQGCQPKATLVLPREGGVLSPAPAYRDSRLSSSTLFTFTVSPSCSAMPPLPQ
ncbi:hypothetical protein LY76DRAFT_590981 [Colletotrichum caudatum]|nr:hypothetical protein LY76DRAFT_590981 [Colletotrichum caudatum]